VDVQAPGFSLLSGTALIIITVLTRGCYLITAI
jgi:hypothetical protein